MYKRLHALVLLFFIVGSGIAGTEQAQVSHQWVVVQAYELLKSRLGHDVPVMKDHIGTNQTGSGW
jgi:hypothetical protein